MSLRPTYTDQKFDSHLLDESQTRQVLGCMLLRPTPSRRETLKICMDARKTRRELDENGHIYRKPGGDWMKMTISTENPPRIGRKWPYPSKTRRELDEYGHIYRKPGEDWTKMAISIENPPRIRRKWPYPPKTRRGLNEYGHIYRKPGGDWTKMAISIENPARIGRKWPYPPKTRRGLDENGHIYRKPGGDRIQYGYSYRILAEDRIPYVSGNHILGKDWIHVPTCRLYLFYIGMQVARIGVNVSRQESRATRGMRSAVCARQSFTLRLPSLAHSPSLSYC